MRIAGLDFGSNTTLLLIADVVDGKVVNVLCDETRITKMGQGVHKSKKFHPDSLARVEQALKDYEKLIQKFQPDKVCGVATSAARDVENSHVLFEMAKSHGVPIEVISGTREAELTFRGAFADRAPEANSCVIDVGGGSTELIFKDGEKIVGQSIDVGSVRLMDLYGESDPMDQESFQQMRNYVRERLNPDWKSQNFEHGVAVAGTPTILAAMEMGLKDFDCEKVDGFRLEKKTLQDWMSKLQKMSNRDADVRSHESHQTHEGHET